MSKNLNKSANKVTKNSFNGIANKFDENIYGTTKGKLRHQLLLHYLQPYLTQSPIRVLDAGGGTGMMSLEFAKLGHLVTLADVSADTLNIAKQRLAPFSNTKVILSEIEDIKEPYQLIVCHAVLEWLNEPAACVQHLYNLLEEGGILSLSFFNHNAKVFHNLLYGNFDYVKNGLPAKNTVRLNPHNAQKPDDILAMVNKLEGAEIVMTAGIRCIHDYMNDKQKIVDQYDQLFAMECEYGTQAPFKNLGKYFYIQVKKTKGTAIL